MEYINSLYPLREYQRTAADPYFVDKSDLIGDVVKLMEGGQPYQFVSRPRRFGKTCGACMVASFFGRAGSAKTVFTSQKIGTNAKAMAHCGRYNVIYIRGSTVSASAERLDGRAYTKQIETMLIQELKRCYPQTLIKPDMDIATVLNSILQTNNYTELVFVMDDWDYYPNQPWVSKQDVEIYLSFLRFLLKDEPIIKLVYFTGSMPMWAYPGGGELDMFVQYTMAESRAFSTCFGFTEEEVDVLYQRYRSRCADPCILRENLKRWYGGYTCASGAALYSPQSVIAALKGNQLGDYWHLSGPDNEIFNAISPNVPAVLDNIAYLISWLTVPLSYIRYTSRFAEHVSRENILSNMLALGFVSYANGEVQVPNLELMHEYEQMAFHEPRLGWIYQLASGSAALFGAIKNLDSDAVANGLNEAMQP